MHDDEPDTEAIDAAEMKRIVESFSWRMENLYKIKDPHGNAIQFKLNWAQRDFLRHIHYFNVILKARQLGFSTVILIYLLDAALFNDNHACGVIAQGLEEAKEIFDDKIKFAYDQLPAWLKELRPLVTDNTREMEFNNGSKIKVGLSLRSGTYQKLHVSEYGKISCDRPDKAKEIKTGAFNTVHKGGQLFVESTAEGQGGEFHDLVKLSRKIEDEGRILTALDPKFHFYAWYKNPEYTLPDVEALRVVIDDETTKYFDELLKEDGIKLTLGQRAWYMKKKELMGDEMMREFPSTPDEAFAASVSGSIYGKQMRFLRKNGRITSVPWDPNYLVHTFWDFGNANYMAIWFFQQVGKEFRLIRYYQAAGQGFKEYIDYMREQPYSYGSHYVPHDGATTRMMEVGNLTYKKVMENLGMKNIVVVPVTKDKWKDIEFICKPMLLKVWIDAAACADGIKCLDNYKKVQNKDGVWMKEPKHDEFSDGADAFRTFAVGYKEIQPKEKTSFALDTGQMAL